MHRYDYSFLKDFKITSKLIGISNVIAESNYNCKIQRKNYEKAYIKLHEQAIIESTISSSRIEGIKTSKKREKELLSGAVKPINHNEEEINGYKDALIFISNHYSDIEIDEETIQYIHSLLMYYSQRENGQYKKTDNLIEANYADGKTEILFEPIASRDVKKNMSELIEAYNEAKNDSDVNMMLLIPCFIVDFLAIHPFMDGNGRISRLITLLLLYKEGYDVGKYISYEKMIEEYKWNYYQELNKSQKGWHENNNDYSPFIIFHFQMLYRCYNEINRRFLEGVENNKGSKNARIEAIIMNSVVPISKTEILDILPDISVSTIEKKLNDLLKEKKIQKIGKYKNARYKKS